MAVFRVERNKGYTVMSNHHLRNKELSLKAKGLLSHKYADEVPGQGKVQGINRTRSGGYYDEALIPTMRNKRDVWLMDSGELEYIQNGNRRLIADAAIWDWYHRAKTTAKPPARQGG